MLMRILVLGFCLVPSLAFRTPPLTPKAVRWGFSRGDPGAIRRWEAWDAKEGWSAPHRAGVDFSDTASWPAVHGRAGGWNFGLQTPQVFVLSMVGRPIRRKRFAELYQGLCPGAGLRWAPAIDGRAVPVELRWMNGFEDTKAWDYTRPGNWACYASHLAILREAHEACASCDLMVFEDDVIFAPDFRRRWERFLSSVPSDWDILRMGAQSQWEPPFKATSEYLYSKAVSNTWGYVVRAAKVKELADLLADLPVRGNWGVDAVMQLFNHRLKTYSPTVPLVQAASGCHDTDVKPGDKDCETAESLRQEADRVRSHWPQGYARTYCQGRGQLREAAGREFCRGSSRDRCCPYSDPPEAPMEGPLTEQCA